MSELITLTEPFRVSKRSWGKNTVVWPAGTVLYLLGSNCERYAVSDVPGDYRLPEDIQYVPQRHCERVESEVL